MRRSMLVVGGLAALVIVGGVALAADEFDLPGFLNAEEQIPVATPTNGQQVAVLEVALQADADKVTAEIRSQQVIDSFGPKSVARSGGDWEVHVIGEKELTYLIPNPLLDVEVENPEDPDNPYDSVPTETLDWTLIVPLYDQGQPLGATRIQVVDVATRAVILETDIKGQ